MTGASPVTTILFTPAGRSHTTPYIVVTGLAPVMLVCYLCYTLFGMLLATYTIDPKELHILCSVLHGIKTNTQRETQNNGTRCHDPRIDCL